MAVLPAVEGTYTPPQMAERELWSMVIFQALLDATGSVTQKTGGSNLKAIERDGARNWLLRGGEDFRDVCEMAGLDPSTVRDRARTLALRGWVRDSTLRVLNSARGA